MDNNIRQFEAIPHVGFGWVHLGMTREQVRGLLPEPVITFARWQAEPNSTDAFLRNAFQVDYDSSGRVEFIELCRSGPFPVLYKGVDVFKTTAEEVVALISLDAAADGKGSSPRYSYTFPELELSVWREDLPGDDPDEPDCGLYFDTMSLGCPGYYSTPVTAGKA